MIFTPAEKRICDRVAEGLFIHGTCPNIADALHFAQMYVLGRRASVLETSGPGTPKRGTVPTAWVCNCAEKSIKIQGEVYCEICHTKSPHLNPGEDPR